MKNVALALIAHPDDAEFLCVGTMIRLQKEHGWEIHLASMTPGDCGSTEYPPDEIARIRRAEGTEAAKKIGGIYHCVEERDMRVNVTDASLDRVVNLLTEVRPRLIMTHSPDDYHPDHEMTSRIVRAATFAAPIPNFLYGRWKNPPLEHIPHLYYCDPVEGKDIFGKPIPAGFCVDISKQIDLKREMLSCHHSQRNWLLKHHGVDNFVDSMQEWAEAQGKLCGVPFAEGFRQHLGHSYPQNNLLGELLGSITPKAR
ncbi:MAG: PIG-L family deacetylase [Planctomycetes bacterium]|nr:PIG-L family deacetylase [Planctomycetota bacterium]